MTDFVTDYLKTKLQPSCLTIIPNWFPQAGRIALFENGKKYFDKTDMKVVEAAIVHEQTTHSLELSRMCKTPMQQTRSRWTL